MVLKMRQCFKGQILFKINNKIQCLKCDQSKYSLEIPHFQKNFQTFGPSECKTCSSSNTISCQGSEIKLKNYYWRKENSQEILYCQNFDSNCMAQEQNSSKQGCVEGHIGPLCESCDIYSLEWKDPYTKKDKY